MEGEDHRGREATKGHFWWEKLTRGRHIDKCGNDRNGDGSSECAEMDAWSVFDTLPEVVMACAVRVPGIR